MKRSVRILLVAVAVICFGVALSYPIRYRMEAAGNEANMDRLTAMREAGRREAETAGSAEANGSSEVAETGEAAESGEPTGSSEAIETGDLTGSGEATESGGSNGSDEASGDVGSGASPSPAAEDAAEGASPSPQPSPTPDRRERTGAVPYPDKEKVTLDESRILPEYREMYELNDDLAGWLTIPGTVIDYPVVQSEDNEFYLTHDFFGNRNSNGQIILDERCDPHTPSYNLVISGHSMKNGSMFGRLVDYMYESYWRKRSVVYFDTLMEHREYVIFAAFFSADYDVDEAGFRYNADIRYRVDAEKWLEEIEKNQLYDTGIDAEFGDEFLTLTTCNRAHRSDGRFVVVCRRIREGETF